MGGASSTYTSYPPQTGIEGYCEHVVFPLESSHGPCQRQRGEEKGRNHHYGAHIKLMSEHIICSMVRTMPIDSGGSAAAENGGLAMTADGDGEVSNSHVDQGLSIIGAALNPLSMLLGLAAHQLGAVNFQTADRLFTLCLMVSSGPLLTSFWQTASSAISGSHVLQGSWRCTPPRWREETDKCWWKIGADRTSLRARSVLLHHGFCQNWRGKELAVSTLDSVIAERKLRPETL